MLTIRVIQPASDGAAGLSARFGAEGGTIGRAHTCTLALPDPDQHISRVQAEIRSSGGGWQVLNRGSVNPLVIGGRTVAPGESHPLRDGDEILVAQFVLRVQLQAAAHQRIPDDPFGDLVPRTAVQPVAPRPAPGGSMGGLGGTGGLGLGLDGLPSAPPSAPPAKLLIPEDWDLSGNPASPVPSDTAPRDSFGGGGSSGAGLGPLAGFAPAPAPAASTPAAPPARSALGIPLLDDPAASRIAPVESIDLLFGLGGPSAGSGPAGGADERIGPSLSSDAAMSDHIPEIHSPMPLPDLIPPLSSPTAAGPVYRSWEVPDEISKTVIVGRGERLPGAPGRAAPSAPAGAPAVRQSIPAMPSSPPPASDDPLRSLVNDAADQHRRSFEAPPQTRPTDLLDRLHPPAADPGRGAAAAAVPDPAPGGAPDSALVAAFLQGAGLAEWPRGARPLDAAAMKRMGELMRLMVQGTIDLLAARAAAKREMRSENTVIVARQNNPLKFSPDASAALPFLLSPQAPRGFVDGRAAVTDAYDDLLAHQAGVVAGMRAAMQGLVARFDPESLEKRLKDPSLLDAMLPMNRKARLWELFGELYADLSREAEDDFEALFGRAFRRAYEAQIEQLERRRTP
jgi:FHA domain-containing protein